jgi:hypothetical protein
LRCPQLSIHHLITFLYYKSHLYLKISGNHLAYFGFEGTVVSVYSDADRNAVAIKSLREKTVLVRVPPAGAYSMASHTDLTNRLYYQWTLGVQRFLREEKLNQASLSQVLTVDLDFDGRASDDTLTKGAMHTKGYLHAMRKRTEFVLRYLKAVKEEGVKDHDVSSLIKENLKAKQKKSSQPSIQIAPSGSYTNSDSRQFEFQPSSNTKRDTQDDDKEVKKPRGRPKKVPAPVVEKTQPPQQSQQKPYDLKISLNFDDEEKEVPQVKDMESKKVQQESKKVQQQNKKYATRMQKFQKQLREWIKVLSINSSNGRQIMSALKKVPLGAADAAIKEELHFMLVAGMEDLPMFQTLERLELEVPVAHFLAQENQDLSGLRELLETAADQLENPQKFENVSEASPIWYSY